MKNIYTLPKSILFFVGLLFGVFLVSQNTYASDRFEANDAVFHIECPSDTMVGCNAEIWDLSGYGWAYVYGYGQPQPAGEPIVNYNLNSCGIGTITRTWIAYDYSGNKYSCTQVIYVGGSSGKLKCHKIDWPDDFHTHDCGQSLHPDDLPYPYNYPVVNQGGDCSNILYSYDDLVFDINPPACVKILRKWTVIDWCIYDPNDPYSKGKCTYTQVLKVKSQAPPTIDCPSDITASANGDCSGTYVDIPPATGTSGCGSNVEIVNHSPFADKGGADASGFYPVGKTKVCFKAKNLCGKWAKCCIYVTVKDQKKPTPICIHGISSTLNLMPDGYYLDLEPRFFNKASFDNCTPKHQLQFEVFPKRLTCEDLGENEVELVVYDASGNSQFCTTYIDLQDPMDMCPPDTSTTTLTGTVANLAGEPMEGLQVVDTATENESTTTAEGTFEIPVYENNTVHLSPFEMESGLSGVTVYDLLLIQKHILGEYDFQSPIAELSADVNSSNDISVLDVTALQMQLLGYQQQMPMGYYGFVLVEDFSEEMVEKGFETPQRWLTEEEISDSANTVKYVGYPLGDVNATSWDGFNSNVVEDRSSSPYPVSVRNTNERLEFVGEEALNSLGMQLQLRLPGVHWQAEDIQSGVLPVERAVSFQVEGNETVLTVALPLEEQIDLSRGDVLFSLTNYGTLDVAEFTQTVKREFLKPEMYSKGYNKHSIEWREQEPARQTLTMNAFPNPFEKNLSLEYYLPKQGASVDVSVYDMNGTLIYNFDRPENKKGWNNYKLPSSDNWPTGIYQIRLKTNAESVHKRVIKTE